MGEEVREPYLTFGIGVCMKKLFGVVVMIGVVGCGLSDEERAAMDKKQADREQTILQELSYLTEESDVAYVKVKNNNVYLGLKERSSDMSMMARGAALRCNKAIDFGCHVWVVDAVASEPFNEYTFKYWEEVTARGGRIQ